MYVHKASQRCARSPNFGVGKPQVREGLSSTGWGKYSPFSMESKSGVEGESSTGDGSSSCMERMDLASKSWDLVSRADGILEDFADSKDTKKDKENRGLRRFHDSWNCRGKRRSPVEMKTRNRWGKRESAKLAASDRRRAAPTSVDLQSEDCSQHFFLFTPHIMPPVLDLPF